MEGCVCDMLAPCLSTLVQRWVLLASPQNSSILVTTRPHLCFGLEMKAWDSLSATFSVIIISSPNLPCYRHSRALPFRQEGDLYSLACARLEGITAQSRCIPPTVQLMVSVATKWREREDAILSAHLRHHGYLMWRLSLDPSAGKHLFQPEMLPLLLVWGWFWSISICPGWWGGSLGMAQRWLIHPDVCSGPLCVILYPLNLCFWPLEVNLQPDKQNPFLKGMSLFSVLELWGRTQA